MIVCSAINRTRTILIAAMLLVFPGFFIVPWTSATEPVSPDSDEFSYVRIFSARVSNGSDMTLAELEDIARRMGSEEVAKFYKHLGPEDKEGLWTLRRGFEEYDYPGYTFTARRDMAEQMRLGAPEVSEDGKTVTETLPCWDSPIQWTFPENNDSPVVCRVFEDGEVVGVIRLYEMLSPSGTRPWPLVIRMDDLKESESVIQVFDYLDQRPDGLHPLPKRPTIDIYKKFQLLKAVDSEGLESAREMMSNLTGMDDVSFDGDWGYDGFDIDWIWDDLSWVEFEFHFGAGATIESMVNGSFFLEWLSHDWGDLTVGSGQGDLEFDLELELTATITFSACFGSYTVDVPEIPQFDFGTAEATLFDSYLLNDSAHVEGTLAEQTIFSKGFDVGPTSGSLDVNAVLSLSVGMQADSITTTYECFTAENQTIGVGLIDGAYSQAATYHDNSNIKVDVTFKPDICVEIDPILCEPYDKCISDYIALPTFTWPLLEKRIDLSFNCSSLDFDSSGYTVPYVSAKRDKRSGVSLDKQGAQASFPSDTTVIASYNFEDGNQGWTTKGLSKMGDFAGRFNGFQQIQEDRCQQDLTVLWAFINESPDNYSCGGHGSQTAIPSGGCAGPFLMNEIWSPLIYWDPAYPTTGAELRFDVYRDLPINYGVFYVWHVRSFHGGTPGPWRDRGFIYYGGGRDWLNAVHPFGDLVEPGAEYVQVALGAWDMYGFWSPYYRFDNCRSHAPLFDNVEITRSYTIGPSWGVRAVDLFQDNFSEDGTTTGTAEADMAKDVNSRWDLDIQPGDSACVWVNDPVDSLDDDEITGFGPSVYCYISIDSSEYTPFEIQAPEMRSGYYRFPFITATVFGGRDWYMYRMDSCFASNGDPVADRYCIDLNDNLFVPGDTCWFFFGARSKVNNWTYWSEFTGTTPVSDEAASSPMEFQILPTANNSDILYVDKFDGMGAQPYFETAFDFLQITPDRYDVRGPSSHVGNSLGQRVKNCVDQLIPSYRTIIWNTGDLSVGTIGDGTGKPCKEDDASILYEFLHGHNDFSGRNIYFSGDDLADEWANLGASASQLKRSYINFNVLDGDYRDYSEGHTSALVIADATALTWFYPGGDPDTMVAFGGCPILNDFDVVEPGTGSKPIMAYEGDADYPAVIGRLFLNPNAKPTRVVLSGFSYHHIRDDRPAGGVTDYVDHLYDILTWFGHSVGSPMGGGGEIRYTNDLAQNYPNPFNPVTTIAYSIEKPTRVSLKIYNVAGQLVKTLIDNEQRYPALVRPVTWDGRNETGQRVASGVYFYRLVTKNFSKTKKMVLLK